MTFKFCKWFENTRFKIPRQRDELHLSDNPTGTVLANLVGDNSVGTTRVPVIGTTRGHPPPVQSASFREVRPGSAAKVRFSVRPNAQDALFREPTPRLPR